MARNGDEELSLFLEMRRREKFQGVSSLPEHGPNSFNKSTTKSLELIKTSCVQLRRSAVEKFLDSENDKSDYEWLLAAPETLGGKDNSMVKVKEPGTRPTALKQRVENIPQEPVTRSVKASKPIPRTAISKQANTVSELKPSSKPSRHATPTSRTSLPSTRQATPTSRTSLPSTRQATPTSRTTSPSTRQATPTSRTTLPSTRQTSSAQNSDPDHRTTSIKSNPRASAFTRSSSVGKSVRSAKSTSLKCQERYARPASTSRSRVYSSGERSTRRSKISNDVNPVLKGTQMVERVVNMRKLPPPKQDNNNTSSNFGRNLSRSSLDMALRHMNIRHSVSKNLSVTTNAPTNTMDKDKSLLSS